MLTLQKSGVRLHLGIKNKLVCFVLLSVCANFAKTIHTNQMKKYFCLAIVATLLASCHESLEDKAEREAKEFTKKNCPIMVSPGITNDSMSFDRSTLTLHYYYSLSGKMDTTAVDKVKAKEMLLKGIKDATSIKKYKENGYNFAYTYFSTKHKGQVLIETVITPKDYNAK